MKRQDIKPGVLYASWRRRDYESPRPIVFLAAPSPDTLYYSPRRGSDGPCHVKSTEDKPRRGRGWSDHTVGYPAVVRSGSKLAPEGLLDITLADFEAATSSYQEDYEFILVHSLAGIAGPWDEEKAWDEARRLARDEREKRERAEAGNSRDRARAVLTALRAHGIAPDSHFHVYGKVHVIPIPLADAERLVSLLAQVPAPAPASTMPPPTHPYAGSNSERQSVGLPGHCERCAQVGHVKAHPDLGCGDVGCTAFHPDED